MKSSLRLIGWKLRRYLSISPDLELTRLQDHLFETCGGGVIGCNQCEGGGFIVPIVNSRPFGIEIPALVCVSCRRVQPLDEPGQISTCEEAPAASASVH
jgi:hypothetical protein